MKKALGTIVVVIGVIIAILRFIFNLFITFIKLTFWAIDWVSEWVVH